MTNKSHQEHPCCGKPAGAPDCGSYEHHAGTVEVWERNGYIPEGGVWTAAERANVLSNGGTVERAANTVAALIRALEDTLEWADPVENNIVDLDAVEALLAAVKGE